MQLASSWTTPSSLGRPPYPTLLSRGSSSTMLTPAMTASRVSPPALITSTALAQQFTPPSLRLALEMTTGRDLDWPLRTGSKGSAAAPSTAARRLKVLDMRFRLRHSGLRATVEAPRQLRSARFFAKICHYGTGQAG